MKHVLKKSAITTASFIIMLCLGSVYAWSNFVPELTEKYNFQTWQTQLVFGVLIAVFPISMIIAGKMEKRFSPAILALISAVFFGMGYIISGFSEGNFYIILLGNGIMTGIVTGFGYLTALSTPVKWIPEKKRLITGLAAAGFGLAAVLMTFIAETFLTRGWDVLKIFILIGISYGSVMLIASCFLKTPPIEKSQKQAKLSEFLKSSHFIKLFLGICAGTFAGLLIIGNLKPIAALSYSQ